MPQLNVHVPETSDLVDRIRAAAAELGLGESSLARAVLEVALEPFVAAQREVRSVERAYSGRLVETLRGRASGALPARRVEPELDEAAEVLHRVPSGAPAAVGPHPEY